MEIGCKDKFLYIEPTICSGCKACVMACSYWINKEFSNKQERIASIFIEETGFHEAVVNCDGSPCNGRPECLAYCPTGALMYGSLEEICEKKMILARHRAKEYNSAMLRGSWTTDKKDEKEIAEEIAYVRLAEENSKG